MVPLQTGQTIYFARACILALYVDQPAAKKCSLTGSACPVCFVPQTRMARAEQEPRHNTFRTEENMRNRKRILLHMCNSGCVGAKDRTKKKAKALGVNLDVHNAWCDVDASVHNRVFGPDKQKDNIWQSIPQPTLHGMDEGLVLKLNAGVLEALIKEAPLRERRWNATEVHSTIH